MSVPRKDSLLAAYSTNFNNRINASPGTFSLSPAQAAAYSAVHEPFTAAYLELTNARAAGVRSEAMTAAMHTAKAALLATARELYRLVQASREVSDADKSLLGITPLNGPRTRGTPPTDRPSVEIVSVAARMVHVRVTSVGSTSGRAKPPGALAAYVYASVGENYPATEADWSFKGSTTRTTMDVLLPPTVAPGAQVWIAARWVNKTMQPGPVSEPKAVRIAGGVSMAA